MDHKLSGANGATNPFLARQNQSKGRRELGYATLLILLLFATLSAYGLEMYVKAHSQNKIARLEVSSRQAVYAAEGGIQWTKIKLKEDPSFTGGELGIGEGVVSVNVVPLAEGYRVTSSAQHGQAKRKIQAEFKEVEGQLVMTKYQEIHQNE